MASRECLRGLCKIERKNCVEALAEMLTEK